MSRKPRYHKPKNWRTLSNIHECVYALESLPLQPPLIFDSEAEIDLYEKIKNKYREASLWLRHTVLHEALKPGAYETTGIYHKPFADFLKADLELCTGVHSRTTRYDLLTFKSPADLWFYSCMKMSEEHLENAGITGIPKIIGKREGWEAAKSICSRLKNLSYDPDLTPRQKKSILTVVILEAQEIAKSDKYFYDFYLLPYTRTLRKIAKQENECPQLQSFYLLPDGSLFVTGNKKKLPKLRKNKVSS